MGSIGQFIQGASFTEWFILTMILLSLSDVWPTLAAWIAGLTFLVVAIQRFK